jgi:conjugal transfer/entry exclusion protein
MIEFEIQIPRNINLSPSTVISHESGNKIFKISNFAEKLEQKAAKIKDQINNQIICPYIQDHLQDYHCPTALSG